MNITETPEKWVILKIINNNKEYFKLFGTWAGGYLGSDSWKVNSGIQNVETKDDEYYYFIGFSNSCYKCHKKAYGTVTSYGLSVLNDIIEKSEGSIIVLEDNPDWCKFFKETK